MPFGPFRFLLSCSYSFARSVNSFSHLTRSQRLCINSKKTEYITFGSAKQLIKNSVKSIDINGDLIAGSTCIRDLGVWANQQLNCKNHIALKCKIAMLNIQRLKQIRKFLTWEAACVIAQGLIILHLDYCNSIYAGLPASTTAPLVQVQVMCAKLILQVSKYHSTSECLQTLHWLLICEWVNHKIITTIYQCIQVEASMYLQDLLVNTTPRWEGLHSSSNMHNLVVPHVQRQIFAARSFAVYSPSLWKTIPDDIKRSPTVELFKSRVKTLLHK